MGGECNHPAHSVYFLNMTILLSNIDYQIQEFVPFVSGYGTPENNQIMFAAGIKSALGELHDVIFDDYAAQRKELHRVDITERLCIEVFYQVIRDLFAEPRCIRFPADHQRR